MDRKTIGAAMAVLALGVGSCGGASKPKLTRAEFVQRADAICTKAKQQATLAAQHSKTGSSSSTFLETVRTAQHKISIELRTLTPPDALTAEYTQYKSNMTQMGTLIDRLAVSASKHDNHGVAVMNATISPFVKHNVIIARRLGFKVCT